MDIARSVALIEEKGTDLERARMRHALFGVAPDPEVVGDFLELQNQDGGFPCGMVRGNLSAVHKTLNAVWWLDEMGMLASLAADRAFGYLFAVQRDDGGWDEDPAIAQYPLPPWIRPGDLGTRVYLSSYGAYWLALRDHLAHSAFGAALRFLLRQRDDTGKFHGFLHGTWIGTSVFLMAGQEYAPVVEQGLRVLMGRPLAEWPVENICWALKCLGTAGLSPPSEHPFIEQGLAELVRRRGADGRWASAEEESGVVTTLQALSVLKLYGLAQFEA